MTEFEAPTQKVPSLSINVQREKFLNFKRDEKSLKKENAENTTKIRREDRPSFEEQLTQLENVPRARHKHKGKDKATKLPFLSLKPDDQSELSAKQVLMTNDYGKSVKTTTKDKFLKNERKYQRHKPKRAEKRKTKTNAERKLNLKERMAANKNQKCHGLKLKLRIGRDSCDSQDGFNAGTDTGKNQESCKLNSIKVRDEENGSTSRISISETLSSLATEPLLKHCLGRYYRLKASNWSCSSKTALRLLKKKYNSLKLLFYREPVLSLNRVPVKVVPVSSESRASDSGSATEDNCQVFDFPSESPEKVIIRTKVFEVETENEKEKKAHDGHSENVFSFVDPRVMSLSRTLLSSQNGKVGAEKTFKNQAKPLKQNTKERTNKTARKKSGPKPDWSKLKEKLKEANSKMIAQKNDGLIVEKNISNFHLLNPKFFNNSISQFRIPRKPVSEKLSSDSQDSCDSHVEDSESETKTYSGYDTNSEINKCKTVRNTVGLIEGKTVRRLSKELDKDKSKAECDTNETTEIQHNAITEDNPIPSHKTAYMEYAFKTSKHKEQTVKVDKFENFVVDGYTIEISHDSPMDVSMDMIYDDVEELDKDSNEILSFENVKTGKPKIDLETCREKSDLNKSSHSDIENDLSDISDDDNLDLYQKSSIGDKDMEVTHGNTEKAISVTKIDSPERIMGSVVDDNTSDRNESLPMGDTIPYLDQYEYLSNSERKEPGDSLSPPVLQLEEADEIPDDIQSNLSSSSDYESFKNLMIAGYTVKVIKDSLGETDSTADSVVSDEQSDILATVNNILSEVENEMLTWSREKDIVITQREEKVDGYKEHIVPASSRTYELAEDGRGLKISMTKDIVYELPDILTKPKIDNVETETVCKSSNTANIEETDTDVLGLVSAKDQNHIIFSDNNTESDFLVCEEKSSKADIYSQDGNLKDQSRWSKIIVEKSVQTKKVDQEDSKITTEFSDTEIDDEIKAAITNINGNTIDKSQDSGSDGEENGGNTPYDIELYEYESDTDVEYIFNLPDEDACDNGSDEKFKPLEIEDVDTYVDTHTSSHETESEIALLNSGGNQNEEGSDHNCDKGRSEEETEDNDSDTVGKASFKSTCSGEQDKAKHDTVDEMKTTSIQNAVCNSGPSKLFKEGEENNNLNNKLEKSTLVKPDKENKGTPSSHNTEINIKATEILEQMKKSVIGDEINSKCLTEDNQFDSEKSGSKNTSTVNNKQTEAKRLIENDNSAINGVRDTNRPVSVSLSMEGNGKEELVELYPTVDETKDPKAIIVVEKNEEKRQPDKQKKNSSKDYDTSESCDEDTGGEEMEIREERLIRDFPNHNWLFNKYQATIGELPEEVIQPTVVSVEKKNARRGSRDSHNARKKKNKVEKKERSKSTEKKQSPPSSAASIQLAASKRRTSLTKNPLRKLSQQETDTDRSNRTTGNVNFSQEIRENVLRQDNVHFQCSVDKSTCEQFFNENVSPKEVTVNNSNEEAAIKNDIKSPKKTFIASFSEFIEKDRANMINSPWSKDSVKVQFDVSNNRNVNRKDRSLVFKNKWNKSAKPDHETFTILKDIEDDYEEGLDSENTSESDSEFGSNNEDQTAYILHKKGMLNQINSYQNAADKTSEAYVNNRKESKASAKTIDNWNSGFDSFKDLKKSVSVESDPCFAAFYMDDDNNIDEPDDDDKLEIDETATGEDSTDQVFQQSPTPSEDASLKMEEGDMLQSTADYIATPIIDTSILEDTSSIVTGDPSSQTIDEPVISEPPSPVLTICEPVTSEPPSPVLTIREPVTSEPPSPVLTIREPVTLEPPVLDPVVSHPSTVSFAVPKSRESIPALVDVSSVTSNVEESYLSVKTETVHETLASIPVTSASMTLTSSPPPLLSTVVSEECKVEINLLKETQGENEPQVKRTESKIEPELPEDKNIPLDLCVPKAEPGSISFRQRSKPPVQLVHPNVHKPPGVATVTVVPSNTETPGHSIESSEEQTHLTEPVAQYCSSSAYTSMVATTTPPLYQLSSGNTGSSSADNTYSSQANLGGIVGSNQGTTSFSGDMAAVSNLGMVVPIQPIKQAHQQGLPHSSLVSMRSYQQGPCSNNQMTSGNMTSVTYSQEPVQTNVVTSKAQIITENKRATTKPTDRPPPLLVLSKTPVVSIQPQGISPGKPPALISCSDREVYSQTRQPNTRQVSGYVSSSVNDHKHVQILSQSQQDYVTSHTFQNAEQGISNNANIGDSTVDVKEEGEGIDFEDDEIKRQVEELDRELKRKEREQEEMRRKKLELLEKMKQAKAAGNLVPKENIGASVKQALKVSSEDLDLSNVTDSKGESSIATKRKETISDVSDINVPVTNVSNEDMLSENFELVTQKFTKVSDSTQITETMAQKIENAILENDTPVDLSSFTKLVQCERNENKAAGGMLNLKQTDKNVSTIREERSTKPTSDNSKNFSKPIRDDIKGIEKGSSNGKETSLPSMPNEMTYIQDIGQVNPFTGEEETPEEFLDLSVKGRDVKQTKANSDEDNVTISELMHEQNIVLVDERSGDSSNYEDTSHAIGSTIAVSISNGNNNEGLNLTTQSGVSQIKASGSYSLPPSGLSSHSLLYTSSSSNSSVASTVQSSVTIATPSVVQLPGRSGTAPLISHAETLDLSQSSRTQNEGSATNLSTLSENPNSAVSSVGFAYLDDKRDVTNNTQKLGQQNVNPQVGNSSDSDVIDLTVEKKGKANCTQDVSTWRGTTVMPLANRTDTEIRPGPLGMSREKRNSFRNKTLQQLQKEAIRQIQNKDNGLNKNQLAMLEKDPSTLEKRPLLLPENVAPVNLIVTHSADKPAVNNTQLTSSEHQNIGKRTLQRSDSHTASSHKRSRGSEQVSEIRPAHYRSPPRKIQRNAKPSMAHLQTTNCIEILKKLKRANKIKVPLHIQQSCLYFNKPVPCGLDPEEKIDKPRPKEWGKRKLRPAHIQRPFRIAGHLIVESDRKSRKRHNSNEVLTSPKCYSLPNTPTTTSASFMPPPPRAHSASEDMDCSLPRPLSHNNDQVYQSILSPGAQRQGNTMASPVRAHWTPLQTSGSNIKTTRYMRPPSQDRPAPPLAWADNETNPALVDLTTQPFTHVIPVDKRNDKTVNHSKETERAIQQELTNALAKRQKTDDDYLPKPNDRQRIERENIRRTSNQLPVHDADISHRNKEFQRMDNDQITPPTEALYRPEQLAASSRQTIIKQRGRPPQLIPAKQDNTSLNPAYTARRISNEQRYNQYQQQQLPSPEDRLDQTRLHQPNTGSIVRQEGGQRYMNNANVSPNLQVMERGQTWIPPPTQHHHTTSSRVHPNSKQMAEKRQEAMERNSHYQTQPPPYNNGGSLVRGEPIRRFQQDRSRMQTYTTMPQNAEPTQNPTEIHQLLVQPHPSSQMMQTGSNMRNTMPAAHPTQMQANPRLCQEQQQMHRMQQIRAQHIQQQLMQNRNQQMNMHQGTRPPIQHQIQPGSQQMPQYNQGNTVEDSSRPVYQHASLQQQQTAFPATMATQQTRPTQLRRPPSYPQSETSISTAMIPHQLSPPSQAISNNTVHQGMQLDSHMVPHHQQQMGPQTTGGRAYYPGTHMHKAQDHTGFLHQQQTQMVQQESGTSTHYNRMTNQNSPNIPPLQVHQNHHKGINYPNNQHNQQYSTMPQAPNLPNPPAMPIQQHHAAPNMTVVPIPHGQNLNTQNRMMPPNQHYSAGQGSQGPQMSIAPTYQPTNPVMTSVNTQLSPRMEIPMNYQVQNRNMVLQPQQMFTATHIPSGNMDIANKHSPTPITMLNPGLISQTNIFPIHRDFQDFQNQTSRKSPRKRRILPKGGSKTTTTEDTAKNMTSAQQKQEAKGQRQKQTRSQQKAKDQTKQAVGLQDEPICLDEETDNLVQDLTLKGQTSAQNEGQKSSSKKQDKTQSRNLPDQEVKTPSTPTTSVTSQGSNTNKEYPVNLQKEGRNPAQTRPSSASVVQNKDSTQMNTHDLSLCHEQVVQGQGRGHTDTNQPHHEKTEGQSQSSRGERKDNQTLHPIPNQDLLSKPIEIDDTSNYGEEVKLSESQGQTSDSDSQGQNVEGQNKGDEEMPHLQQIHGTCILCGKYSLYLCSSCKKIWYCSPQCQLSHWETHANECEGDAE